MKARRRPGRKRIVDAPRRPDGKAIRPEDARETAIEARMRLFGLSREEAVRQEAGSAIGRALNNKDITRDQFDACMEWLVRLDSYERAIGVRRVRSASDYGGAGGFAGGDGDEPDYVERCQRACRRYGEIRRWVMDADAFGLFALETWVKDDIEAYKLVGSLRVAANAIHRLLRLDKAA
jgi:hypothetical protein